jgi:hypothetical protein
VGGETQHTEQSGGRGTHFLYIRSSAEGVKGTFWITTSFFGGGKWWRWWFLVVKVMVVVVVVVVFGGGCEGDA